MAKTYRCRPSEVIGELDPVLAFLFDRAVFTLGRAIEDDMEKSAATTKSAKGKDARRNMVLQRYLNDSGDTRGVYRDPAARR